MMAIRYLTVEEHIEVLENLVSFVREHINNNNIPVHKAGLEYTSLMVCFLLENLSASDVLLNLYKRYSKEWFPSTIGYIIVRPMFEIDVNSHYISKDPKLYSRKFIDFGKILKKQQMNGVQKHINTRDAQWREGMQMIWDEYWNKRKSKIEDDYNSVKSQFEKRDKKGRIMIFSNWSGKKLREMAVDVNHEEAYDIFYSDLSSFVHADVHLADRFLKRDNSGLVWSQRQDEFDVGSVFRYADIFLACFLELFGDQFTLWDKKDVRWCWEVVKAK